MARKEKTASFYTGRGYIKEGTFERHKPLYYEVARLLPKPNECSRIIDLGCGVGFFAKVLYERGYKEYTGIDFSKGMLKHARRNAPEYDYIQLSLYDEEINDLIKGCKLFTILETLEHLKDDLGVLNTLPSGATIVGSVPSADSKSHVRRFLSIAAVVKRYSSIINFDFLKTKHMHTDKGGMFVIFRGNIK